jgi:Haem-NO-binding
MYGLVNRAIEQLVVASRGELVWARVCARAGLDEDSFISLCPYDDALTYRLVDAVSVELGASAHEVLEAFGEHWILYTAQEGYAALLDVAGRDLRGFLGNLDAMHGRVEGVFQKMRMPHFTIEDLGPGDYLLHYESDRVGLAPMVLGLLRGLAKRFNIDVRIEQVSRRDEFGGIDTFRVFELQVLAAA